MSLRYPIPRLLILDLLSNQKYSVSEAIAKSACQYGLIAPEHVCDLLVEANGQCTCMPTAKNVLFKHFECKDRQTGVPPVNVNDVWSEVERLVDAYQGCNSSAARECGNQAQQHNCARLAPAVFDYLLQQLSRYP